MQKFSSIGISAADLWASKVLASTVLEAEFSRSTDQAEIENSNTKLISGNPKITLELKYLTKQKNFISKSLGIF